MRKPIAVMCLAAVFVLAATPLPAEAKIEIRVADDFNDNAVNRKIWGAESSEGHGVLTEANRRLEFTVASPTSFDRRRRKVVWGTGPYNASWETQIDVTNRVTLGKDGQEASFGLSIRECSNYANEVYAEAYAWRGGSSVYRGFFAQQWTSDVEGAEADTSDLTGGAALAGRIRLAFNASTKVFTTSYALGDGSWMDFGSFGVDGSDGTVGNGDWGMTDADEFCIVAHAWSAKVAVTSGRVFGDNFSATGLTPAKILLVQPNSGVPLPSGLDFYPIAWFAPANVASVRLAYSCDKGATWKAIGPGSISGTTFYGWEVPVPAKTLPACVVRVTGYNAANKATGSDVSDKPFAIEVVRVTSPTAGASLPSGVPVPITWTTNVTKSPVDHIVLSYTLDGGASWRAIDTAADPGDDGSFLWTPAVAATKSKCKVKIVLKDGLGATVGSDASDGFFTITAGP